MNRKSPKRRVKRAPSVTSSRPGQRARPLATLGKLSNRKRNKITVTIVKAGKMSLLSRAEDFPSAVMPNPPALPVEPAYTKIMELPSVESYQQVLSFKIIRKNLDGSSSASMLFHSSDVSTQIIKGRYNVAKGKLTLVGDARKMMRAATKSSAFKSNRTQKLSEVRSRSESTASQGTVKTISKEPMSDFHYQEFFLSRLYDIKYSASSPTKLSLVFHVEDDYLVEPTTGWPGLPEFDEIALKFDTNENLMKLLKNLLQHVDHTSAYFLGFYKIYLDKRKNQMVDEGCQSGRANINNASSMLRASIDLAALSRGSRSKAVSTRCDLLVEFLKDLGDNFEEAGFWKNFSEKIKNNRRSITEPKSGLLEVLREEMKSENKE